MVGQTKRFSFFFIYFVPPPFNIFLLPPSSFLLPSSSACLKLIFYFSSSLYLSDLHEIPLSKVFGLIVNYVTLKWFGLWESRHWFPMRPMLPPSPSTTPMWYSFDSNLPSPYPFASDNEVDLSLHHLCFFSPLFCYLFFFN